MWAIAAAPFLYASSCAYISHSKGKAFDRINIGDTEEQVIRVAGSPSFREQPGKLYTPYASQECQKPCVERLWFENRLSLDGEAWVIELGDSSQVIHKTYFLSP